MLTCFQDRVSDMSIAVPTYSQQETDIEGRYEYRVWPRTMAVPAVEMLQRSWLLTGAESRSDIYLVSPRSHWTLAKLRSGMHLEIKQRQTGVAGGLQHWTVPVSAAFPLAPDVRRKLASAIAVLGSLPSEAGLSPAHLVAALETALPGVVPVTAHKSRLLFRQGTSRAEICRTTILGNARLTLCVEDAEASSAAAAVRQLQLGNMRNLSYGDMLNSRLLPVS